MFYKSTRSDEKVLSAQAIINGLASDGGLFVPEAFPQINLTDIENMEKMDYLQQAEFILSKYLTDYSQEEIKQAVAKAYNKDAFGDKPVELKLICHCANMSALELWHGPTFAFKDMALQLLPQLLTTAIKKTGKSEEIVILVATSGDTGKAALEGFADVPGTRIIVFYPQTGVSDIQKLQMITQKGANVNVYAVKGNFDDAQNGVKKIFNNVQLAKEMKEKGYAFSSANSINWGRLVPQIVYYFSAYSQAIQNGNIKLGDKINFVVPTGNFGNILAGYYAKKMGLPINKFICASNSNNVLTDFINTGIYDRNREFHKTISPSMDILISSNLERLLYHLTDGDTKQIANWMEQLNSDGKYDIGEKYKKQLQEDFWGYWVDENDTSKIIKDLFESHKYLLDTHTAVAWKACQMYRQLENDGYPTIILSTASPFKFAQDVLKALEPQEEQINNPFEALIELSDISGLKVPIAMELLAQAQVLHDQVVEKEEMPSTIKSILRL